MKRVRKRKEYRQYYNEYPPRPKQRPNFPVPYWPYVAEELRGKVKVHPNGSARIPVILDYDLILKNAPPLPPPTAEEIKKLKLSKIQKKAYQKKKEAKKEEQQTEAQKENAKSIIKNRFSPAHSASR